MDELLVLIVDDEHDHRRIIQLIVEELVGARTALAGDGEEAVSLALRLQPALIVLDIRLPGLPGYEVARRLREDPTTCYTPILWVTADSRRETQALRAAGATVIEKPFDLDHVADAVRACLSERMVLAATA